MKFFPNPLRFVFMEKQSLKVHLIWSAIVGCAFALGTAISTSSSSPPSDLSTSRIAPRVGTSQDSDLTSPDSTKSRLKREAEFPKRSRISELFGSLKAGSAGLDQLAKQALQDPNPITRRLAFGELLASMTPENAAEIREKLLSYGARGDDWNDFNYSWGAMSGRAALDVAAKSDERDLTAVMTGWAAANPTEAIALLNQLPPEMAENRVQIAEALISGLADTDTNLATTLALGFVAEGMGEGVGMLAGIANEVLRGQGPAAASIWASSLPDGDAKGAAMSRIAGDFARIDPKGAASWIEKYAKNEFAARAIADIGGQLGRDAPTAAVAWLEGLPPGAGQLAGLQTVLGDWEDSDPQAASRYLAGLPNSQQRDAAISGFARGYAWQEPQAAIQWAQDISDPAIRQQTLIRAGQAYFNRDPESARAWFNSSGLPAEAGGGIFRR